MGRVSTHLILWLLAISQTLPFGFASRRNSLTDQMAGLSMSSKTKTELERIEPWEMRAVNSAGLTENCYYCTAAALTGRNTNQMVGRTETMQGRFGTLKEALDLLRPSHRRVQSRGFVDGTSMRQYLSDRLQPGFSDKFGIAYYHTTRPITFLPSDGPLSGHMVAMKAWKNPDGSIGTREVDFQKPPNQRFSNPPNNNWTPPGPFYLIDLNPRVNMNNWRPNKRPASQQLVNPKGKVHRFWG